MQDLAAKVLPRVCHEMALILLNALESAGICRCFVGESPLHGFEAPLDLLVASE